MIVKCECGTQYNNQTVSECPLCKGPQFERLPQSVVKKMTKDQRRRYTERLYKAGEMRKEERNSEVDTFLREDRSIKSKIVNSYRRSSLAIWQTQKRNPGKVGQFRGAH